MRSHHGEFPEYHTSADNLDFVDPGAPVADSFATILSVFDVLEHNRTYMNLNPKCEPQLGKRGLYSVMGGTNIKQLEMAMLWVLNQSDGTHSLLDIAERSGLAFVDDRRGREIVRRRRSVVTESAQLAQPVLELVAQGGIRPGLLVAQGIRLQDPDGREDRDRADDQDADQELDRGAPRDRRLRLPPASRAACFRSAAAGGAAELIAPLIGLGPAHLSRSGLRSSSPGAPTRWPRRAASTRPCPWPRDRAWGCRTPCPSTTVTVVPLRVIWEPVKSVVPPQ